MSQRTLHHCPALAQLIVDDPPSEDDSLRAYLEAQAETYQLHWLLAHLDDGVLWGRFDEGRLITSHEAAEGHERARSCSPPLRALTLQQARLFAPHAEVLVWRDDTNSLKARLMRDTKEGETPIWQEGFDESQLLWGDYAHPLVQGFSLLEQGQQGLLHTPPLALSGEIDPPRLRVRHYLNSSGFARIDTSRLCELSAGGERS
ncbi:TIGR03984 family CRISPR-associated protein [Lamprobacter modestohalophilus]|uniref:TIGR03984 family CRISPR-associated protein n=1 Tax=Lamprobacter modestohalophilus TaxID=1064514 RepID=A0A9X0WBK7_9GAMM|nr:CRISPR-associated protein Csx19 [Lamprobacter modestohalophilus]MBK1620150.1 TIGR03984 family CRISPR-associated protein [Lamprobacter modestohalophilus]